MRIVSLLPCATEIVCALGLEEHLLGVTYECYYPPSVARLPRVTRTLIPPEATSEQIDLMVREQLHSQKALYSLDLPILQQLQPDLLLTQALCSVCAVAEDEVKAAAAMLPSQPQIVNLEPHTLADVLACIRQVGQAANQEAAADQLVTDLQRRIAAVAERSAQLTYRPRVTLLEWIDPPFSCGHWIPELIDLAGGIEGLGQPGCPSRTLHWEEVVAWQPEVMILACCGFDLERTLQDLPRLRSYPRLEAFPCTRSGRIYAMDGSAYFSRPGPRLVDSLEILAHALHPEVHPLPPGLPAAWRMVSS